MSGAVFLVCSGGAAAERMRRWPLRLPASRSLRNALRRELGYFALPELLPPPPLFPLHAPSSGSNVHWLSGGTTHWTELYSAPHDQEAQFQPEREVDWNLVRTAVSHQGGD